MGIIENRLRYFIFCEGDFLFHADVFNQISKKIKYRKYPSKNQNKLRC